MNKEEIDKIVEVYKDANLVLFHIDWEGIPVTLVENESGIHAIIAECRYYIGTLASLNSNEFIAMSKEDAEQIDPHLGDYYEQYWG